MISITAAAMACFIVAVTMFAGMALAVIIIVHHDKHINDA